MPSESSGVVVLVWLLSTSGMVLHVGRHDDSREGHAMSRYQVISSVDRCSSVDDQFFALSRGPATEMPTAMEADSALSMP